jgi:radical SAM superfamily enzyme YgiQ (UPF0313 family)
MKILLVTSPHLDHSFYHEQRVMRYAQCFVPMGLVSLAGSLQEKLGDRVEVTIADINKAINLHILQFSESFYDQAAEWIQDYSPDIVGFMTECDSYHHVLQICSVLRTKPECPITVLGCTHASATHAETLRDFACVDYIIRGEGELALPALVEALATGGVLDAVSNLSHRKASRIVANPEAPLIENLDTLPFPQLGKIDVWREDIIYVEIGRGCPFRCNFCFTAPYWKRKHRIKSAERILRELNYFKAEYRRTDFNFTHDLFTVDKLWVLDFCKKLWESDLNINFTISSRTDTIDEEQIYWLARAGCRDIYFGVETGTERMQKEIQKHLDLKHARRIIAAASEAGIGTTVGFIAGLPGETRESLRGSLTEAFHYLGLPKATVHMFGFGPYRGSSNYELIAKSLVFDEQFLDFPLPRTVLAENCKLMRVYQEIFSRYSRVPSETLDVNIVRSAEEFFPVVNALRRFLLWLAEEGCDMFDVLCHWAEWIKRTNLARNAPLFRSHQGSIGDFLVFIEGYLDQNRNLTALRREMIGWERAKDRLRRVTIIDHVSSLPIRDGWIYSNPTLSIQTFSFIHSFLKEPDQRDRNQESAANGGCDFAFYVRRNGDPAIMKITPRARALIECAREGVDATLLGPNEKLMTADDFGPRKRAAILSQNLETLMTHDLIFDARDLIALAPNESA